jgi:PPOX class probable F420-dependent enzyme
MPDKVDGQEVDPRVLELARGQNFGALTTLLPDGHPQTQVMWVDADEQHLLLNTEVHRQKFRNVERDPRVTVTIWDMEDPYRFVEVRGEVVEKVKGQEAREHIDELSL